MVGVNLLYQNIAINKVIFCVVLGTFVDTININEQCGHSMSFGKFFSYLMCTVFHRINAAAFIA